MMFFVFLLNCATRKIKNEREIGLSILSQLSMTQTQVFKSFDLAESILQRERFASVKTAAVNAIGHFCRKNKKFENRAIKLLSKTTYDKSVNTRCATAAAFFSVNSNDTIPFLLTLLNDCDGDVRNWAAFTVNFNQYDSTEIRESFIRMLTDKNDCARIEAISGLAERKDNRVITAIINELQKDIIFDEVIISAGVLGNLKLLPILKNILNEINDEDVIGNIKSAIQQIIKYN
ncbi:HEAT repeat domain-containing protein [Escherichia sp. E4742]|uniref:HEAT repeat domain-containing protein n=1 Tax=Escherichia sp. E4742 TaxID=2044467 RepID=UPI001F0EC82B|nr:HEAT repeat domain-containing protein [Escherichia sp. E4742]